MPLHIGYCTNVHAGSDLALTRENLERHALEVKRQFSPDQPMGVGLWLSAPTAATLQGAAELQEFADWLRASGLVPFTLNGFPYGDFHQPVVKHRVYEPTWREPERQNYTQNLITLLDALLPAGEFGSISTLPIEWGEPARSHVERDEAAARLRQIAESLARLEAERGRWIQLCLEPEPGCVLQRSGDVVEFFEQHLLAGGQLDSRAEAQVRRHLAVCHDVCHAAVMFESQRDVLQTYRAHGIAVGKVQVSSAIVVPLEDQDEHGRQAALGQLRAFAEDRYLHQTVCRMADGSHPFFEDLPAALEAAEAAGSDARELRVHFHVPVYLERFGALRTSRPDVETCLAASAEFNTCQHFEVETYAWGVLPAELQQESLATGIAQELHWFAELAHA